MLRNEPMNAQTTPRVRIVAAFGYQVVHTDRRLRALAQQLQRSGKVLTGEMKHQMIDALRVHFGRHIDNSQRTAG